MNETLPDLNEWSAFVQSHPQGNIFNSPEMFEVYRNSKNTQPILTYVSNGQELKGIMLGVIIQEKFPIVGGFTRRSIIIGGPLAKDQNSEIISELLSTYLLKIKGRAIYTQFRNLWKCTDEDKKLFAKQGYKYEEHLDIIHDLSIPIDEQLAKMHSGRRKNIRRAEKWGLVPEIIMSDKFLPQVYSLITDTYKRVKLPLPEYDFFLNTFKELSKKDQLKVFIVKFEDKIIAARIVLCYKELVYDWYAGSDENYLDKYPNDYLPWAIMKWAAENNFKKFDFGGAGKPGIHYGVRDYKLKFGGKLVEHGRFTKVHNNFIMKLGKIGFKIYKSIRH